MIIYKYVHIVFNYKMYLLLYNLIILELKPDSPLQIVGKQYFVKIRFRLNIFLLKYNADKMFSTILRTYSTRLFVFI